MRTFYDRLGIPTAFALDDGNIHFYSGEAVAYMEQGQLFTSAGRWLGWAEHGWVYDREGFPALFDQSATGRPARPALQPAPKTPDVGGAAPSRSIKDTTPMMPSRSIRDTMPSLPKPQTTWSSFSGAQYFQQ